MICSSYCFLLFFFFFQAEDGIRDLIVTGVQTCALPISSTYRSPGGPPLRPASPSPASRTRSPLSTPAGTFTESLRVRRDRKSTRLNSSHDQISYAVFCLKKKNKSSNTIVLQITIQSQSR